jgi:TolA-binding protein
VVTAQVAALALRDGSRRAARDSFRDLAVRFPETPLAAWARYRQGDLGWRDDRPHEAADVWQSLWENEPYAPSIPGLLERLAEARHRAARDAFSKDEFAHALVHLAFLCEMPETRWRRDHVLLSDLQLDMAECHLGLGQWQDALDLAWRSRRGVRQPDSESRALYVEGRAHWGLREYDAAVEAWQTAVAEYPVTAYAAKCQEHLSP